MLITNAITLLVVKSDKTYPTFVSFGKSNSFTYLVLVVSYYAD